ncbi:MULTISPECIES: helix-turn-helix domain-containing protein [unclassified Paenibacillus]|uniref:helix-turn-helix domain-containing protein n=1 Tax=unclassified Paenibacillus TaxID=185978 RepID=UPI0009A6DDA3|nr:MULTISPECIES: helix-turn-helix transcriptional regulator [unclassified Paenibacillus]SLJ92761.1 Helix-turn-helix domain-containing protein [Paenibacillus sp. RU5A]SOC58507.1 Helix-turn-helix domain-containing protein [Paenibacillus sp. RU26A]SOC67559.1 Helix-turn-helix domain-containing protein [Paenibacillus sp. RU5M]
MKGSDGISIAQKLTLKEARENFGYSLKDAARKTGITESRISEIEIDASHAAIDEFVSLCQCYGTNCNHVYSGVASEVNKARNSGKSTDFNEVSQITQIKLKLAELIQCMGTDDMFTRQDIHKAIREIFHDLHEFEEIILSPFLNDHDNIFLGGRSV